MKQKVEQEIFSASGKLFSNQFLSIKGDLFFYWTFSICILKTERIRGQRLNSETRKNLNMSFYLVRYLMFLHSVNIPTIYGARPFGIYKVYEIGLIFSTCKLCGHEKVWCKNISIMTEWVVFNLLYLVNQIVYPQSDEFPIVYETRPFETYVAFSISSMVSIWKSCRNEKK